MNLVFYFENTHTLIMHSRMLYFKIRHSILILSAFLLSLLLYMCWDFQEEEIEKSPLDKNSTQLQQLVYNCCTPLNNTIRKNIFFLKTHKTGSTTVHNIIIRFALRYSLDFLLPIYTCYNCPFSQQIFYAETVTPNNKYNVLAHHMRYSSQLKDYQYPGAVMVTILRHPATLFQSMYEYFMMPVTMGMTFEQFLNAPVKPAFVWGVGSDISYRGYNQMSVDLGFDLSNFRNETAIVEFVSKIDREFDFVMIMEHMDASLILLANLMGWPLEYVVHLKVNSRPPNPYAYTLTEQDKITLLQLNEVDAILYHHFLQKFFKCVRQYGVEELNRQISTLRRMNKEFKQRCVAGENYFGLLGAVNYVPKTFNDLECIYDTKLQIPLAEELRMRQAQKLWNLKAINKSRNL